jgi:glucarate dehydratase
MVGTATSSHLLDEDARMSVVARIEAWPVNVPLVATYLMAPGVYPGMSRTVVRVTTADGVVGLGETPSPDDAALLAGELGSSFVGRDTDTLREELGAGAGPSVARTGAAIVTPNAAAGVEIALWDIAAREAGVPLCELLDEVVREEIAFTEYFAPRPGREETPAAIAEYCARMVEGHASPAFEGKAAVWSPGEDLETVRLVREAIGPDRLLRLDANTGWSLDAAARMLAALEPYGIANVEEPVASFAGLAELRKASRIPFSSHTPDAERASSLGVPDTFVVGVGACGGITGTLRFVEHCARLGVGFWFYSGDLGIATAAQLHVTAVAPTLDRPSQSLLRWTADDVTEQGVRAPEGGVLRVPDGPGLGVTLDERALARCVERFAREGPYELYTGPPLPRW